MVRAKAWPNLEIGSAVQHGWDKGASHTTIGPGLKYTLPSEGAGFGLGIIGAGSLSVNNGRLRQPA